MPDFYRRACAAHEMGRPRDAIRELHAALAEDPNDAPSHALLAMCLCAIEDYAGGLREAEAAIAGDPELGYSFYARAWIFKCQDKYDDALKAIEEALRLEPRRPGYWACKAEIESRSDRQAKALESSGRGLEIDPQHGSCLIWRAQALRVLKRLPESLQIAQQALQISPENDDAHAAVGWVYLDMKQRGAALPYFRDARRLNPRSRWARNGYRQALRAGWANLLAWVMPLVIYAVLAGWALDGCNRLKHGPKSDAMIVAAILAVLAGLWILQQHEECIVGTPEGRRYLSLEEPWVYYTWACFAIWLATSPLMLLGEIWKPAWIYAGTLVPTAMALCRCRKMSFTVLLAILFVLQIGLVVAGARAMLEGWPQERAGIVVYPMLLLAICIFSGCYTAKMPGAREVFQPPD